MNPTLNKPIPAWKLPDSVERHMARVYQEIPVDERYGQLRRWCELYRESVGRMEQAIKAGLRKSSEDSPFFMGRDMV